MGTIPNVLHRAARPITVREFMDAVQATCPPRFPQARANMHRTVGLAVSGGVDSMALAFLCSQVRKTDPMFRVSDCRVGSFQAFIVDHKLRDGSTAEAHAVRDVLQNQFDLRAQVVTIGWGNEIGRDVDPNSLPNLESMARKLRYRVFGRQASFLSIVSLLLAHHEDDQYETVLMRLISGHGMRGLRGMRTASDIPECYDMHGAYQSGFVDDQKSEAPFYNLRPSKRDRKYLRADLRREIDFGVLSREISHGSNSDVDPFYLEDDFRVPGKSSNKWAPPLAPLDIEDCGIMVYRPLLQFSKDRLIATCLENNVPWFEDRTNQDPTLTTRNALRHMCKTYTLPVALQKPAVLRLAERCNTRAAAENAEAERLVDRTTIQNFEPNIGTVIVQFPQLCARPRRRKSRYSSDSQNKRLERYRTIAALLVQKMLALVTPETQVTPPTNLQLVVTKLFPNLSDGLGQASAALPKAFNICGVHFLPIQPHADGPVSWYLAREPYPSHVPLPKRFFRRMPLNYRWRHRPEEWKWPPWSSWHLYDGRFWIRVCNRLPSSVVVMPFEKDHAKPFREALLDDTARDGFAALLKRHAPGKVRYTLPALYASASIDAVLKGGLYGTEEDPDGPGPDNLTRKESRDAQKEELRLWEDRLYRYDGGLRLLALPTLGVHLPGIEHWVQWEVRYRKVDTSMLDASQAGYAPPFRRAGRHGRWVLFGRWSRRRGKVVKAESPLNLQD